MPEENSPEKAAQRAKFIETAMLETSAAAVEAAAMALVGNSLGPLSNPDFASLVTQQISMYAAGIGSRILVDAGLTQARFKENFDKFESVFQGLIVATFTSFLLYNPDIVTGLGTTGENIKSFIQNWTNDFTSRANDLVKSVTAPKAPEIPATTVPTQISPTSVPTLPPTEVPTQIPTPLPTPLSPEQIAQMAVEAQQSQEKNAKIALVVATILGVHFPTAILYKLYGEKLANTIDQAMSKTREKFSSGLEASRTFFSKFTGGRSRTQETATDISELRQAVFAALKAHTENLDPNDRTKAQAIADELNSLGVALQKLERAIRDGTGSPATDVRTRTPNE